jgi:hypothetical protein
MTSAVWTEPLAGSATGGSSIARWLTLFVRWLRGAVSPAEAKEVEVLQARVHLLGASVLDATSRDGVTERIDAALTQPELMQVLRELAPKITPDMLASTPISAELFHEMEPVLGKAATAVLASTVPVLSVSVGILARLFTSGEVPDATPADAYEALSRPGIHSTVKRGLLGAFRSTIAIAAIGHATFQKRRLEPWLALALAEVYRDELYWSVRVFASLPLEVTVPESVVPLHDRFDLERLQAEVEANEFFWEGVAGLPGEELVLCDVPDDDG